MKAEREKRAVILEAEGMRQADITRAEGKKQAVVLEAEGRKEAAYRDAEARERSAQAEATATGMVSRRSQRGSGRAQYFIAEKYVRAITALAEAPTRKYSSCRWIWPRSPARSAALPRSRRARLGEGRAPTRQGRRGRCAMSCRRRRRRRRPENPTAT